MNPRFLRATHVTFSLYLVATWTSMAGMEIFGWLSFLLASLGVALTPELRNRLKDILQIYPWKMLSALVILTGLGLLINGTDQANAIYAFGSQRWVILLLSHTLLWTLFPPSQKWLMFSVGTQGVIAIYAITQAFTGIDLLRGDNRAVQGVDGNWGIDVWRSAGFFGSPHQWAFAGGMFLALATAIFLHTQRARLSRHHRFLTGGAWIFLLLSQVTTFGRGAWIATLLTQTLMWSLMFPKRAKLFVASILGGAVTLILALEPLRERAFRLLSFSQANNSDRLILWRANWEMFKENPVWGLGYLQNEVQAREWVTRIGHPDAFTGHAHNNYIQMLSGMGAPGFVLYLALIAYFYLMAWKLWREIPATHAGARALALASLGAQTQLHIGGFIECNFKTGVTNHNLMVIWSLTLALAIWQRRQAWPDALKWPSPESRA
ncbi:MAG TPA: O-antigen ligase family protein [Pseudobdellovibrionaceae bacterium]|nr:O-antigen ligase family protein [Pseudobdellovibrionaceae bacterium]